MVKWGITYGYGLLHGRIWVFFLNIACIKVESKLSQCFRKQVAIKCADISNPCRHWEVCLQWATNITDEFFRQGDRESVLGLPVMSFMDRSKTTKAKVQIGKLSIFTDIVNLATSEIILGYIFTYSSQV